MAVVIATISTMVSVLWLIVCNRLRETAPQKVRATLTTIIISSCFAVFNALLITAIIFESVLKVEYSWYFMLWYAAPINSAINPFVYFLRIHSMRKYLFKLVSCRPHCGARQAPVSINSPPLQTLPSESLKLKTCGLKMVFFKTLQLLRFLVDSVKIPNSKLAHPFILLL